jgi:hypothetical protein
VEEESQTDMNDGGEDSDLNEDLKEFQEDGCGGGC